MYNFVTFEWGQKTAVNVLVHFSIVNRFKLYPVAGDRSLTYIAPRRIESFHPEK